MTSIRDLYKKTNTQTGLGAGLNLGTWDNAGTFTTGVAFDGNDSKMITPIVTTDARSAVTLLEGELVYDSDEDKFYYGDGVTLGGLEVVNGTANESIVIYLGGLDTDISATTKAAIIPYLPYNLEVSELVLECDVAPTGSNIEVDINVDGTSFLTTIISIDATETSSTTATTAYVIDTTTFPNSRIPKGSTVTVDIDQVGSTVAGQNLVLVINGVRY